MKCGGGDNKYADSTPLLFTVRTIEMMLSAMLPPLKKEKESVAWTTDSEIEYLNAIGTFRPDDCDRITFLKGYIAAIPNRVRWAGINRLIVTKHAKTLLQENLDRELC